jgi:hypothetical protein
MTPLHNTALQLPQQDLERCTHFVSTSIEAVTDWVNDLALGSPHKAGSHLRGALSELNRVELPPVLRFRILEVLRAPICAVIDTLTQACLQKPIVLDENSQIEADIVADLCSLASAGYTLVTGVHTIQGSEELEDTNPARLACEALHRAVVQSGQRILHSYLLYQPMELNCWAGLHQRYALAERQQLARLPVEDPVRGSEEQYRAGIPGAAAAGLQQAEPAPAARHRRRLPRVRRVAATSSTCRTRSSATACSPSTCTATRHRCSPSCWCDAARRSSAT